MRIVDLWFIIYRYAQIYLCVAIVFLKQNNSNYLSARIRLNFSVKLVKFGWYNFRFSIMIFRTVNTSHWWRLFTIGQFKKKTKKKLPEKFYPKHKTFINWRYCSPSRYDGRGFLRVEMIAFELCHGEMDSWIDRLIMSSWCVRRVTCRGSTSETQRRWSDVSGGCMLDITKFVSHLQYCKIWNLWRRNCRLENWGM